MKQKTNSKQYDSKTSFVPVEVPRGVYGEIQQYRKPKGFTLRYTMPLVWEVFKQAPAEQVEAAKSRLAKRLAATARTIRDGQVPRPV